jgi:hypothetical protein
LFYACRPHINNTKPLQPSLGQALGRRHRRRQAHGTVSLARLCLRADTVGALQRAHRDSQLGQRTVDAHMLEQTVFFTSHNLQPVALTYAYLVIAIPIPRVASHRSPRRGPLGCPSSDGLSCSSKILRCTASLTLHENTVIFRSTIHDTTEPVIHLLQHQTPFAQQFRRPCAHDGCMPANMIQ